MFLTLSLAELAVCLLNGCQISLLALLIGDPEVQQHPQAEIGAAGIMLIRGSFCKSLLVFVGPNIPYGFFGLINLSGDSYSSTGFEVSGVQPDLDNAFGNPSHLGEGTTW